MKALFKFTLVVLSMVLFSNNAFSQESYKPSDKWPYVFEKFSDGVIHQNNGRGDISTEVNVCVDNGKLHYVDNGVILEATTSTVKDVEVAGKKFINVFGSLMEVLYSDENGYILLERKIEAASDGVDIGFGIVSSTTSAQSVDLAGSTAFGTALLHSKVAESAREAKYGTPLKLAEKKFYYVNGSLTAATKKEFQQAVGKDTSASFLKQNKINWNETASIAKTLELMANSTK